MSVLRERLLEQQNGSAARVTGSLRASNELQELKARVHRTLINKLDLSKLENADPAVVQNDVKKVIERILDVENAPMSGLEREQVQTDVLNELFGLGPLEPLLADKLEFPAYFGRNWDALEECLRDLSWLPANQAICLIHEDLPLRAGSRDREIYLSLLAECPTKSDRPHPIRVVFPSATKAIVQAVLNPET